MTPIKEIIRKIRIAVHDLDGINYDARDILNAINAALRIIRRNIAEIQPELIMETTAGMLQAGEDLIILRNVPMKIIELTAGDKVISSTKDFASKSVKSNYDKVFGNRTKVCSLYETKIFDERPLEETTFHQIRKRNAVGRPRYFYRIGMRQLKVYPTPKLETAYTLRTVDDIHELRFDDETPLINEFDDFLIEYGAMRLSLADEFDVTQEQQLLANIHAQISKILSPPPAGVIVKGYW